MRYLLTILVAFVACHSFALSGGQVTASNATSPFYILDSNNPCNSGPRAAYIGIKIKNISTTDTLFNIYVKLDSIAGNAGFRLLGPFDSTENIGRILPRDSGTAYFYVKYPCVHNLTANYFFKIGDKNAGTVAFSTSLYTRSSISANAGGQLIDQKLGFHDALGTLVSDTVTYEFGNIQSGDEFNIQPNGDTTFKAGFVRLLNATIISSDIPNIIAVGTKDKLYYVATNSASGSGKKVKVVYFFLNHLYNDSTTFYPYAGLTSGSNNFKYTGNYGTAGVGTAGLKTTTASKKMRTTMRASCGICTPCDSITYTVKIENLSNFYLQIDQIKTTLPSGYSYLGFASGGNVNRSNSSNVPDSGATGIIYFKGYIPTNIFPFESYLIAGGDSLLLKFNAKLPCTSSNDIHYTLASPIIGALFVDTVSVVSCAGCSVLPVELMSFYAKADKNKVLLNWQTASERNNQKFDIFRSYDGLDFNYIGTKLGRGNSQEINTYSFTDYDVPSESTLFYKLNQIDFDGHTTSYFAKCDLASRSTVLVVPNPFTQYISVSFNDDFAEVKSIRITDYMGRVIRHENVHLLADEKINFTTENWPAGFYYLHVMTHDYTRKIIKLVKL